MSFAANPGGPRSDHPQSAKSGKQRPREKFTACMDPGKIEFGPVANSKSLDAISLESEKLGRREEGERRKVCGYFFSG
jgi:hypothetical protein